MLVFVDSSGEQRGVLTTLIAIQHSLKFIKQTVCLLTYFTLSSPVNPQNQIHC